MANQQQGHVDKRAEVARRVAERLKVNQHAEVMQPDRAVGRIWDALISSEMRVEELAALLPETWYVERTLEVRLKVLVAQWVGLHESHERLERELDKEASSHLLTIDDRDSAQDAIQQTHIALGGDGEWITRLPEPEPPESGDLCKDVPVIARQIMQEAMASQERAEKAEARVGELEEALKQAHELIDYWGDPTGYDLPVRQVERIQQLRAALSEKEG